MHLHRMSDRVSVAGQIRPEDLPAIRDRGFRSIICNRPDGEEPGQPPFARIAEAAAALGMEARTIPFTSMPGADQSRAVLQALKEMEGPVLAYCRSGARSGAVCHQALGMLGADG